MQTRQPIKKQIEELERNSITEALAETAGDVRKASGLLGVAERWMWRKMTCYSIPRWPGKAPPNSL